MKNTVHNGDLKILFRFIQTPSHIVNVFLPTCVTDPDIITPLSKPHLIRIMLLMSTAGLLLGRILIHDTVTT
jgi:hypothetical protein